MNSETRVRIAFDSRQRQVELVHGEAFFEVTQDALMQFVVVAGGHRVTALGTSFVVRYQPERTAVMLVEGRVAVDSVSPPGAKTGHEADPWMLSAGQHLTFAPVGIAKIDVPSVDSVLAWRRGEVVLNDTPLQEAVAEMNHYDKTTLVIESPAIATLAVSGLYHTGDNEGFARAIAKMYHLELDERDGRIYLKSR
jgi:transmembrane sensor